MGRATTRTSLQCGHNARGLLLILQRKKQCEKFLCQPAEYWSAGLQLERFPPNSGDLRPIETVRAWLQRDLAEKEQADHAVGKVLTAQQFRQRAALLLKQYGEKKPGSDHSRWGKLVRGMPKRLQKCKERRYGRCGK